MLSLVYVETIHTLFESIDRTNNRGLLPQPALLAGLFRSSFFASTRRWCLAYPPCNGICSLRADGVLLPIILRPSLWRNPILVHARSRSLTVNQMRLRPQIPSSLLLFLLSRSPQLPCPYTCSEAFFIMNTVIRQLIPDRFPLASLSPLFWRLGLLFLLPRRWGRLTKRFPTCTKVKPIVRASHDFDPVGTCRRAGSKEDWITIADAS